MNVLKAVLLTILFISCQEKALVKKRVLQGNAFGTTYTIQFYSQENTAFQSGIDSTIARVNSSVSTYLHNSDISKINRGDTTIATDSIFQNIFHISKKIHKLTDGYFDPTVGVLRNAYGFGDVKPLAKLDKKTLDSLMDFVGFNKVTLLENGKILKEHPQIYIDFNAIAKGYGIDCIGKYLLQKGISNFLIELGGEILTKGNHPDTGKPWTVGIEAVNSKLTNRSLTARVALRNSAMASSGNYRKFRVDSLTGKKYVHTINPLTGSAEQSDVTSATVTASTCAVADAYATAFMALGLEKSKEVLKKLDGIEVYLTYTDSLNHHQTFISEGFKKMIVEN